MLHPHPALSPVPEVDDPEAEAAQRENEAAWCQLLVQGALAVLLPTEDLENGCLRTLVGEIFAEMVLRNGVGGRACEGWLLWEGIIKIVDVLRPSSGPDTDVGSEAKETAGSEQSRKVASRLEQYGLVSSSKSSSASAPSLSSATGPLEVPGRASSRWEGKSVSSVFWLIVQYAFWTFAAARYLVVTIATSSSLPARSKLPLTMIAGMEGSSGVSQTNEKGQLRQAGSGGQTATARPTSGLARPVLSMSVWGAVGRIVELDARMPWLAGLLGLLRHGCVAGPRRVGDTDGVLDRWVHAPIFAVSFLRIIPLRPSVLCFLGVRSVKGSFGACPRGGSGPPGGGPCRPWKAWRF
ncbi:hypothetical protein BDY21DRAFT_63019 [Lineolata rhizophorae]|uniref:PXA domain-containing protein n=1 Tax=Lineolata rhizophorae TaxID=578093 RepID=A0A6A6NVZ8_9PEZI|nr:hypothetical protein BDY21DRAFT_63019 [Lineolata rhizophorae]